MILLVVHRGGNWSGRVGFGFESDGSDQFDFLEEIGSGRVGSESGRVGSIYMLCFFRFLIDFDLIEGHLISGRVLFESDQFDFFKKSDRVGFRFGRLERVFRIGSDSVISTAALSHTPTL
jgi:hypothetical protein